MTEERDRQLEQFGKAVDEKKQRAKEASEATGPGGDEAAGQDIGGDQQDLYEHGRPQDTRSARAKNAGKGKKTADKWNQ